MMTEQRILLMGQSGTGKTSMRSVVFSDFYTRDSWKLPPTMQIDKQLLRIFGHIEFHLWDCGGQDTFMKDYLGATQSLELFSSVAILVYVLDLSSSTPKIDLETFEACVGALRAYAPDAKLFVLLHKSDLLACAGSPSGAVKELEGEVRRRALPTLAQCFVTSIWEESLYRAWSAIIVSLIPNLSLLQAELSRFLDRIKGEEVILFEPITLLALAHVSKRHHSDPRRFEKLSNVLKQLRAGTRRFNALPNTLRLILDDGTGIVMEQLSPDALLLLTIPHVSDQKILEIPSEIATLRPLFVAITEGQPELDPHML